MSQEPVLMSGNNDFMIQDDEIIFSKYDLFRAFLGPARYLLR